MAGKYDKKKPRKARPVSADKTRRAAAVAKARSKPSPVVKAYVDRKLDAAVPDQTFNYRYVGQLPINGTSLMSPILALTTSGLNPPGQLNAAPWLKMIHMNLPNLYSTRNGGTGGISTLFPRLKIKLKGIRISGQVSIPALAGQTGTGWAHVKIIAFEDRAYDPHQLIDGVTAADVTAPGSNILMDRRTVADSFTWQTTDCSFPPGGGYPQESASFNTSGFKMLGVANIGLYNSVMNPQHNLKKFAFNLKCPQYLTWRQKDSSGSVSSSTSIPPANFFPCIAAYATYENGATAPVDLQLDTAIRVEPVAN